MKRSLALILTLLCAGTAQAETDMSQYKPILYCGPIPKGRVIVNEGGRKEVAGKRFSYIFKGEVIKFEERYITFKGQKCAVKVFGSIRDSVHKKQDPVSYTIENAFDYYSNDSRSFCYEEELSKLYKKETDEEFCLKDYPNSIRSCVHKSYKDFNKKGYVGYYFTPTYDEEPCGTRVSGFYYVNGELGLLKFTPGKDGIEMIP